MRTLIALVLFLALAPLVRADTLPNIVIIFTDDQGYTDVGCYGAQGFTTPHLDALAARGMRFTQYYAAHAVCSASRAALMTGCYANRVNIYGAFGPNAQQGLHPDESTIAELLKPLGYATGCVGKWHLGREPELLPAAQGFDEYLGLPYSNDMWPVDYDGTPLPTSHWKGKQPPLPLIDGTSVIDTIDTLDDQCTLTGRYTERAVRFIDEHASAPFFLYFAHSMPHVPLGASPAFRGASEQGFYGDVIQEIDWSVGQVLAALDRNGVRDNTLVIFTSDNGPWLNYGNHAGSCRGLREGKGTAFEGGQRVPCIVSWPGRVPENVETNALACAIDILPTIAELVGAPLPERPIDGVSQLDLITGRSSDGARTELVYYYGRKLNAVRRGTWKLHVPHGHRSYRGVEPGMDGWPGAYAQGRTSYELYDLGSDPGEYKNVADLHPEIVAELTQLAESWIERLGDGEDRPGSEQRAVGKAGG